MAFVRIPGLGAASIALAAALTIGMTVGPSGAAEPSTTQAPAAPAAAPNFELKGSRIIGCCCAHPCPCRLNKKPMHSHGCDHTDAIHINQGFIGDVNMSGVSYVVAGRGFGSNTEGNWAYVYVGDNATEAQYKALEAMMNADVASWGLKAAHLAGKFLGMRKVPMTYTVSKDKNTYECTIPGILEFKNAAHYNPGHKEPVMSTGIMDAFGDKFVHADCLVHKYNDAQINYSWDLTGRQSNQAEFVLTDEKVAAGGIGWGCWTAHSEFGDKDKYQEEMIENEHN
jgi:hypothetical protein